MYLPHLSGGGKLRRGGTLGKIIRGHGNLEVSVLDVLKVANADDPAGAGVSMIPCQGWVEPPHCR